MNRLKVYRYGINEDSFMITKKLLSIINLNSTVKLTESQFLENKYIMKDNKKIFWKEPKSVKIEGSLKKNINLLKNNTNILGKNDFFIINSDILKIPVVKNPTKQLLAYYNCELIFENEIFKLKNNKNMYYFNMEIGINYLNGYLLRKDYGNGFYLETHDTPHFHTPVNDKSKGYIVIGKKINNKYELTAFRIPYKCGIYIPPNVPHCDGTLIGEYNVLYTITNNYETNLLYNTNDKIVEIIFEE